MSAKIMGQVYDLDLPANEQSVLLALADHADHDGNKVFPSNGLVAWKIGCSEDTVTRMKKRLESRGILVVMSSEPGCVKEYRIAISAGKRKEDFKPKNRTINPPQDAATRNPQPPANSGTYPPQTAATPPAELCGTNRHIEPSVEPSIGIGMDSVLASSKEFVNAWNEWNEHRRQKRKPMTALATRKQLELCSVWGVERSIAAIDHSIRNSYQGIYEPSVASKAVRPESKQLQERIPIRSI